MKNNRCLISIVIIILIVYGCSSMGKESEDWEQKDKEFEEKMIKMKHPYQFYLAIYNKNVDLVKRFLDAGANPNKCMGENGWVDSNPLKVVTEGFYNTYDYRNNKPKLLIEHAPDVAIIELLINAGADINKLPYVWNRVYRWDNHDLFRRERDSAGQIETFIKDVNRVLKALLEKGADPDILGHPYPFGYDWKLPFFTDRRANKYFTKGTRAINEAIKKGIIWESQIDLLLQYTKLDEESLKAAEESNDSEMIEKINRLWEIQKNKINN